MAIFLFLVDTMNGNRFLLNYKDFIVLFENVKILFKVSKVVGCGLKRIGDLSYDFRLGACGTYRFPEERILLCFSEAHKTKCERYVFQIFSISKNSLWAIVY